MEKTQPREYRSDWIGEHFPLETPFGTVTIQPLGWGLRVETRTVWNHSTPDVWERDAANDPPLTINGRQCRLGHVDFPIDDDARIGELGTIIGGDLTPKAEARIREILPPLVRAWLEEHMAEFVHTRAAYVSNRAATCEESIRELEDALELYRTRLEKIEAGDLDVSPYLNGGRRLLDKDS